MRKGILYIMVLLLAVGCRLDQAKDQEPLSAITMPISIALPVDNTQALRSAVRRSVGDPGSTEHFALPQHIYFFVLKYKNDTWSLWHKEHLEPTEQEWTAKRYKGLFQTAGDSIYQYTKEIDLLLNNERFDGMVLAIASTEELVFNTPFASISTADQVRNLQFSVADPDTKANLENIYSSPDNYEVGGKYYGAFNGVYPKVPHVDLLLYHVAAKVDIKWNVEESVRVDKVTPSNGIRLTSMKACHLFNGNAYCFKPMQNVLADKLTAGYEIEIVRPVDEGLWWEGRYYFYTIPYTVTGNPGYFPLQMEMETNESGNKYRPTLNLGIDTSSPFVPWLRAMFNISNKLTDTEETKTIDL